MTDSQPEPQEPEHTPGIAELATLSSLKQEWKTITIQQFGPDGSEVIAMLVFYSCPICAAVVPPPVEGSEFAVDHANHHISQARDADVLNRALIMLANHSHTDGDG